MFEKSVSVYCSIERKLMGMNEEEGCDQNFKKYTLREKMCISPLLSYMADLWIKNIL